jgi:hypothetical protein
VRSALRWACQLAFSLSVALDGLSDRSVTAAPPRETGGKVSFREGQGRVVIEIAGRPAATYLYADREITRPYLAQVLAPGGVQVTRNHPPKKKDLQDHAAFHPGIWLAFGDVSGHDYWRLKAKVEHDGFLKKPQGGDGRGGFTVRNKYLSTDGKSVVCTEACRLDFHLRPTGYLIVWQSTFSSDTADFSFGDQEEMGLGVRLATPLAVASKQGGAIRDSEGRENERSIWGKQAAWCDYSGVIGGRQAGVTVMPDPGNFRPCWWHVRDYGLMVANPFGRQAFTRGEESQVIVNRGEPMRLRFGVLVHSAEKSGEPDLASAYRDFLALLKEADSAAGDKVLKYVRPSGDSFSPESELRRQERDDGYEIISTTHRPGVKLTLTSRYGAGGDLREANVTVENGKQSQSATATVTGQRVEVRRAKGEPRTLDCPAGVIVTSAPDWTDAVLAVRRFDPKGKDTQEFPGLWIHPAQEPLRITIKLTRRGKQTVLRENEKLHLVRYLLQLRGGSRYELWADPSGQLIRLAPDGNPRPAMILSGWEKTTTSQ